ncbi:DNA repair protein RAD16 [Apiospora marii]|uniref:DNA repair protein RAD16 n=1 Tax=Apiospora marii TaxID=335849 RepID=UPI0031317A4B
MAPRTRRSLALGDQDGLDSAPVAPTPPKRGRGRPPKAKAPAVESESVSSALSPAQSVSESGEYSTPATSNAVTPAPSVVTKQTATKPARRSLVVELPSFPTGEEDPSDEDDEKPKGFGSLSSRARRARKPTKSTSYVIGDLEDDDGFGLDGNNSPDGALARRLQREEDMKAVDEITVKPSSSKPPPRRSARTSTVAKVDDDDEEYLQDVIRNLPPASDVKGKGKAPAGTKRKYPGNSQPAVIADSADEQEDDDEADYDFEEDDDEPLRISAPARKKAKTTQGPPAVDPLDSEDEVMATVTRRNRRQVSLPTSDEEEYHDALEDDDSAFSSADEANDGGPTRQDFLEQRRQYRLPASEKRQKKARQTLESNHPVLKTMWKDLENMPVLKAGRANQPMSISRQLKPFQLEGLAWMKAMEGLEWKGGLLGDEMGLGKTIQAVSLIMSDYPAKKPSLVLVPPVALMQWTAEIESYTDGKLKTLIFHGTNAKAKNMTSAQLKKFDVLLMSYNSLESIYRKQEKGFKRKNGLYKEKSAIHSIQFHRVILDEAHCIKTRTTMTAKACFALKVDYRWCLTGTPLQNRIGEFFSLIRFLNIKPFASYLCKNCPCSTLEWSMDENGRCNHCSHNSMRHVSVFNQELLNPIQKYGNRGEGKEAFVKLRLMTDRIMLRRLKKDHTDSMELPVKEIYVDRQFFGEEENDFANSIMSSGQRKFDTYVAQGVLLNNYANIFGLIMQMRQVADHPDLILKKSSEGGQNVLECCICDEPAEEAIRSRCKHDFCRSCAKSYVNYQDQPSCPKCHIPLSIDLEQPEIEQDEALVKKSSIINRIKMENWTSSSKIELLVHEIHRMRKDNGTHKSIIFSQFTTMLQLIEWRLRRAGITTVMLDGSMSPAQRQASINHFMTNVDVECFLVSLKAGGVALNLTEASRVFIVDPWWNPAAEWQSADRCHRIGQTRPCIITRLCIEDSVESRMVLLQEKKTNMINSTINSDDAAMESLTPEDLQFLFRGS